jgi:hypothetical protein
MKRKPAPDPEPRIPDDLIEAALRLAESEKTRRLSKCTVCGDETAPNSTEGLCWVCRRLKISAWKDQDLQMGAQE